MIEQPSPIDYLIVFFIKLVMLMALALLLAKIFV